MIPKISSYRSTVGNEIIKNISELSAPLEGKHVVHLNSTATGGGVSEILNTLVFLMNDAGIQTGWRVMLGSHSFFKITKGMHNALQGKEWKMSKHRRELYEEYCKRNATINHFDKHDIVVIHDPQPLGMISHYKRSNKWLWRCHIDLSQPNPRLMEYFLPFIQKYDGIITSKPEYSPKGLGNMQSVIHPSIDPLSAKNKKITPGKIKKLLSKKGIDLDKPIISQISRFDPWKGQLGVLKMYQRIREQEDCQLVLMGDMASDDPEGPAIYHKVARFAEKFKDIHLITEKSDLLVNALQAKSNIVFQNSLKEGFGLTVSEALWKKTPVLATNVGGLPLQVIDGRTGYLIKDNTDGASKAISLLRDPDAAKQLGEEGHLHVKRNFLITRHLTDYLHLFRDVLKTGN